MALAIESVKALNSITLVASETEAAGAKQTANIRLPEGHQPNEYTNGTGAGQASAFYVVTLSLAGSAQTFNLASPSGGIGTGAIANVKGFKIYNLATNAAHTCAVGNAASNAFPMQLSSGTTTQTVYPGGSIGFDAPLAANGIDASSNGNVKFDPGANTFDVVAVFWGE